MAARILMNQIPKGLLDGLVKTELYVKKSGLDLKLTTLIKYRVSQINGCAYCLDMHHKEAIESGESELRLHTVIAWRECPYFTEAEKAALHFAESLTLIPQREIDDALFNELEGFYTKEQIALLTLAITQINSWNRINILFGSVPGNYQVPVNKPEFITEEN